MAEVKACLFDLDGVIVDTAVFHYQAWKKLANSLGFDFDEKQNEQLKGVSRVESLRRILAWGKVEVDQEKFDALAAQKNAWYVEMIQQIRPQDALPGAVDFLKSLHSIGIKTALGSASKNAGVIIKQLQIEALFDAIIDGNHVEKSKPDPEVFLKGAAAVGVAPENCVVFEDAEAGIAAAKAGHMMSVGIGSADVLTEADMVVPGLSAMTIEKLKDLQ